MGKINELRFQCLSTLAFSARLNVCLKKRCSLKTTLTVTKCHKPQIAIATPCVPRVYPACKQVRLSFFFQDPQVFIGVRLPLSQLVPTSREQTTIRPHILE